MYNTYVAVQRWYMYVYVYVYTIYSRVAPIKIVSSKIYSLSNKILM